MGISFFSILPLLLFYVLPIGFVIWFAFTIVRLQKEKNEILQSIADKLDSNEKK
ncbi:hypothetical protein [Lysinibacillus contaminans]|uniref:hypothetical protein n=1 Tax=Lysinibacillus contaminans TaxID=1293441 RepID=UPI000B23A7B0|nr:hypothetical protein [Lysinibacillus contaminans]